VLRSAVPAPIAPVASTSNLSAALIGGKTPHPRSSMATLISWFFWGRVCFIIPPDAMTALFANDLEHYQKLKVAVR
jgi:hypothetical protein